jgi:DNA invertase Pin-like site-specific DNA recombinase
LLTGDANGARRHPERLARGDANGSRKHPESRKRGSEQKNARVSEADIPAIRSRRKAGETLSAIAKTYGVSLQTIWRISKGESWKHI